MKAIEFTTTIDEGIIRVPQNMKPYYNSRVRVLILTDESEPTISKKEKLSKAIKNMEKINMFSNIENPTEWQKTIRNEWQ